MADKARMRLDSKGVNKALQAFVTPHLERAAREVQKNVPSNYKVGVIVDVDRRGRPRAMIAITEPGGLAAQAKHGVLTRAAAAAGLDVHRYPIEGA